ncbi:MAG: hypothetical protein A3I02_11055 [Betaproteobacteria bacterium RIFCSPLOWO2_02_FULL_67_26]|nr:MAG: hypothetical protein A3I02_11055 [Betaproteobacteria bacterium RIFCSPLOWO2_02_FULL_67_26]
MNTISVQLSLYPLRQSQLGPAISRALELFRARGLDVRPGTMSTVIVGDVDAVFDGLKASFQTAAALGDVVMVASVSNCCPAPAADRHNA